MSLHINIILTEFSYIFWSISQSKQ